MIFSLLPGQLLILVMVLLLIKHYLADYPLQSKYMLGKTKKVGKGQNNGVWLWPLLDHCAIHGALTALFLLPFLNPADAIRLAVIDFSVHFVIDCWKARSKQHNVFHKVFWNKHGLDQLFHHLSYVGLTFLAFMWAMKY